jgi:hypothetical protein
MFVQTLSALIRMRRTVGATLRRETVRRARIRDAFLLRVDFWSLVDASMPTSMSAFFSRLISSLSSSSSSADDDDDNMGGSPLLAPFFMQEDDVAWSTESVEKSNDEIDADGECGCFVAFSSSMASLGGALHNNDAALSRTFLQIFFFP